MSWAWHSSALACSKKICYFPVPQISKRPLNGHFCLKIGHFGWQNGHGARWKYCYLNGSDKLTNCTSVLGLIHFAMLFITFLSLQGLKMVILDRRMDMELSENIFTYMASSNLVFIWPELRVSLRQTGLRQGWTVACLCRCMLHCFPTLGSWLCQNNLQEVQL